jgi:hypothetical protein
MRPRCLNANFASARRVRLSTDGDARLSQIHQIISAQGVSAPGAMSPTRVGPPNAPSLLSQDAPNIGALRESRVIVHKAFAQ